ncbi:hypothetical protein CYMTET_8373, partial [Cymbomonas tetramitiformis]
MCAYLVVPDKPDTLTSMARELRWVNFQFNWPMRDGADMTCTPRGEVFREEQLPEAGAGEAWAAFVNTWCIAALVHGALAGLQLAIHAAGLPLPALLRPPRLQLIGLQFMAQPLMQSTGFVLAHANSGQPGYRTVCALLGFAVLLLVCLALGAVIHQ